MRRETSHSVPCRIVAPHQTPHQFGPVSLRLTVKGTQHGDEGPVESFTLTVTLRVVRCGAKLLDPQEGTHLLDEIGFKIGTLISDDLVG